MRVWAWLLGVLVFGMALIAAAILGVARLNTRSVSGQYLLSDAWLYEHSAVAAALAYGAFLIIVSLSCAVAIAVGRRHRSAWGWGVLGPLVCYVAATLLDAQLPTIALTAAIACPLCWVGSWVQGRSSHREPAG